METKEIAKKLVAYCRKADWSGAQNELYDQMQSALNHTQRRNFPKKQKVLRLLKRKVKSLTRWLKKFIA